MFTLENVCDVLKDELGVQEIILEIENEIPTIIIAGKWNGKDYQIKATNADFAEHGL